MAILSGKPESKSTAAAKAAVAKLQDLSAKELIQRAFEARYQSVHSVIHM